MDYNAEIVKRFAVIETQKRLAHAYLFVGPHQSGKAATVTALAKMFNCENKQQDFFCGQCASCRKINAGNHPDMYTLTVAVGETIKIEDIRQFIERSTLRPFEAKWKVFLICDADRMTKEAANALLKTLEEPHAQTMIFLTTAAVQLCLETIKSRCHQVHFFSKSQNQISDYLMGEFALDQISAQTIAFFADGSHQKAKVLYEEKFNSRKNKIIDEVIMKRNCDEFLRKALSDKEETQTLLTVILSFFRDLLLLKAGVSTASFANQDRVRDLQALSREFSFDHVNRIIEEIIKAIRLFKDNLNVKMSLSVIKELVWVK